MRIESVSSLCYHTPIDLPSHSELLWRDFACVYVDTDEGISGFGFTSVMNHFAVREYLTRVLAPFLVGKNPVDTEAIWHQMFQQFTLQATTGIVTCAMSAIDIALWDIKARALGVPLYSLLGGYSNRVQAYATFGLLSYSREELASIGQSLVEEGYTMLKMVVGIDGASNLGEDEARVRALRKAVGDDIGIMVDANKVFTRVQAAELARRLEPYNIAWFEEPLLHNDVAALAELRTRTRIPIAAGQQEGMKWRHRDLILGNAVDVLQTDVALVGGFSEAVKVAHLAQAFDLPITTNGYNCPHLNMQFVAAVANGWLVEVHSMGQAISNTVFVDAPRVVNGWIVLPEKPGLGMEIDNDRLSQYQDV